MARSKTGKRKNVRRSDIAAAHDTAGPASGPSPNPRSNLIMADIALRSGGILLREAIERKALGKRYNTKKAHQILKGRTFSEKIASRIAAKIASSSVPGALLMGGGMLAKTLYDRRKGSMARHEGEASLTDMAMDGAEEERE